MKINKIQLNNFGSYQGENTFDTSVENDKNIILIGGKNGAGKTTLFSAVRICLYGFMSMGYKNKNSFYNKEIIKLINNTAKMSKPVNAGISLNISLSNGQELDTYIISRNWLLTETLSESVSVIKNGTNLDEEATTDFQKYIFNLIPPDLFNLFFFDGEKIADFFMNEGADNRIKNAFLTLCGYDTFEIMRKNFKRVNSQTQSSESLKEYLAVKALVEEKLNQLKLINIGIETNENAISLCTADIDELELNYKQSGGVAQSEWDEKINQLKEEEKLRETLNNLLKKWANEVIPFIIIREQILKLREQITSENNNTKYKNFEDIINSDSIKSILNIFSNSNDDLMNTIKKEAYKKYGSGNENILDLSFEKSATLLAQVDRILAFEVDKILKLKKQVKRSLNTTSKIRKELEKSSIVHVQEYMKSKAFLYEHKSELLNSKISLEQELITATKAYDEAVLALSKLKIQLESDIKKASIKDIATKSILMLDKLQESLFSKQIGKVEKLFKKEIKTLMRKTQFIDDIVIDDDFVIHIYRNEVFTKDKLIDMISNNGAEELMELIGSVGVKKIKKEFNIINIESLDNLEEKQQYLLPIEIDKTSLSNGEKQIFIMSLYHSLVQLCSLEIPFIIDTPFARIDTEHRQNISKYFFKKLRGQVFILSTNEEIDASHVMLLNDKIMSTFVLENTDNKKTDIIHGAYFKEEL